MVLSEKSYKKLKNFLNPSVKVKHRFISLESFHEYANQLEIAEFYEENSETLLLFLLECYLLMIGKTWVLSRVEKGDSSNENSEKALKFAFGDESFDHASDDAVVSRLLSQSKRILPTNSEAQGKWMLALRKERNIESCLRFPFIFKNLLLYVSIGSVLSSKLAPFLVTMIRRLLHGDNLAVLRVEGLKMLLNLLKASSHEASSSAVSNSLSSNYLCDTLQETPHPITVVCTEIFASLVDVEALLSAEEDQNRMAAVFLEGQPLIPKEANEFEPLPFLGSINLEMLNEIFAFITWDLNPDLHSTRFLYILLRDCFLCRLFPVAFGKMCLASTDQFDQNIRGNVLELVVEYFSLWFLKSGNRDFKFSSMAPTVVDSETPKNQMSNSMVSLVVNDISNFLGVRAGGTNNNPSNANKSIRSSSSTPILSSQHRSVNEFPIASFLLEEVILGSKRDVLFVHFILKTACYTLSFASHIFSIKLTLEIFRSWVFNPTARRPQFLQDNEELDKFVHFYLECVEGLFPHVHLGPADHDPLRETPQMTLIDRVDVYRECFYFFRALALQAFFTLKFDRWLQLLNIEISTFELLLAPENQLERPFFTNEDSLFTESLLGSLLRSCEHFDRPEMKAMWRKSSAVLAKCAACRGIIEEWCRVIEALALLLVKDPLYNGSTMKAANELSTRPASPRRSNSSCTSNVASSHSSLPPTTSSFSAWPELLTVKENSIKLFRNMLRILGDLAGGLPVLKESRPDLMILAYEAMSRCLEILLKCRADQPVNISSLRAPPICDFIAPALSALLNLKSYSSIVTETLIAHDATRIVAWKMIGQIFFRPADIPIPKHYWAALLLAAREALREPMSPAEFIAFMVYNGIPLSGAQVPGITIILPDVFDAILRFFNDVGGKEFSVSEANFIVSVSVKIASNCVMLGKIFPETFGYFRGEDCFFRLFKQLISTISDSHLLTIVYTALAEIICSEIASVEVDLAFSRNVLNLMLEAPMNLTLGKNHIHVVICISHYLSALAYLKVTDPTEKAIDGDFILQNIMMCIELGSKSEDFSEVLIRLIQGPLSDWTLFALRGTLSDPIKAAFSRLLDLQYVAKEVKISINQLALRLLAFGKVFPGSLGSDFVASEGFNNFGEISPLIHLALTPSHTILSFYTGENDEIYVLARNTLGKFVWKLKDIWANNSNTEELIENEELNYGFNQIAEDSEFPLPRVTLKKEVNEEHNEADDVLRQLFDRIRTDYPETAKRSIFKEPENEEEWQNQIQKEEEFIKDTGRPFVEVSKYERKRPTKSTGRFSIQLRLLLSSLGLNSIEFYATRGGFGVEVLKESTGIGLEEELRSLDAICSRTRIKIGLVYMAGGVHDEAELLTSKFEVSESYKDFVDSIKGESKQFSTPMMDLQIDTLEDLKAQSMEEVEIKKHLGNDSVLVIWHGSGNGDTWTEKNPLKSDVTAAIIRVQPHSLIPGWFLVSLQTCFDRLLQPRKFARLRFDPFTLVGVDESLDLDVDGVFSRALGTGQQHAGILVPLGSLGSIVRALSIAAWQQALIINCLRLANPNNNTPVSISAQSRLKYAPDIVRRDRIDEIIQRHGMNQLPYDQFIASLFQS